MRWLWPLFKNYLFYVEFCSRIHSAIIFGPTFHLSNLWHSATFQVPAWIVEKTTSVWYRPWRRKSLIAMSKQFYMFCYNKLGHSPRHPPASQPDTNLKGKRVSGKFVLTHKAKLTQHTFTHIIYIYLSIRMHKHKAS